MISNESISNLASFSSHEIYRFLLTCLTLSVQGRRFNVFRGWRGNAFFEAQGSAFARLHMHVDTHACPHFCAPYKNVGLFFYNTYRNVNSSTCHASALPSWVVASRKRTERAHNLSSASRVIGRKLKSGKPSFTSPKHALKVLFLRIRAFKGWSCEEV